jgi:NAD(P)H-flavin reductase
MIPRPARLRARRREIPGVVTLEIEPQDPRDPATTAFAPGQFNMLGVFGVGEVPISFSGDPAQPQRLIHTIRSVGAVTAALTVLEPGDPLGLRGPFGLGWPLEAAEGRDVVIIAGGLGLAPLRPVLYAILAERARYGAVTLIYGARGPEDILFQRELQAWARGADLEVMTTVDHAPAGWRGEVGVVTRLIPRVRFDPARSVAFVCGPEVMMRFAIAALSDAGLPDDAVHLSMERNMECGVGFCGHCQFGPFFLCKDGPVFRYDRVGRLLALKEF